MNSCRGKITANFDGIVISSDFDSGNLDRVEECRSTLGPDSREFNLWTAPDCAGSPYESGCRSWFYFSVTVPSHSANLTLRFNVQNLNKQSRLYQQGLTPIIKTVPGRGYWERLRDRVEYEANEDGVYILSFHLFVPDSRKQTIYCAFCYPHSYTDCQRMLSKLDEQYSMSSGEVDKEAIYYHRELVCPSLEGRRVDLITVSSCHGLNSEREPRLDKLFPDTTTERAHTFTGKKVILLTSRVHPGETPSSHVLNGFLQFILRREDPRAVALRRHFLFKLIPLLNPDGVSRGHYRMDTLGVNLNRMYIDPDYRKCPSIFAAWSLICHHHNKGLTESITSESSVPSLISTMDTFTQSRPQLSQTLNSQSANLMNHSQKIAPESKVSTSLCSLEVNRGNPTPCSHEVNRGNPTLSSLEVNRGNLTPSSHEVNRGNLTPCSHEVNRGNPTHCSHEVNRGNPTPKDAITITKNSGIAFYIDLHAHASKRGCFFYGNHFSDIMEQTENMLFPRLVSLNSPHLDFEQCVFSEKNMYTADKRDGMSKEGSGRVAMYKATGIIHSYTLECNYNSGRQINSLGGATLADDRATPPNPGSSMSHQFNIQDFEQVGHALAVATLDYYQLNPWTRLPNTEYKSLTGVRESLHWRIKNSRAKREKLRGARKASVVPEQSMEPSPSSEIVSESSRRSAQTTKLVILKNQRTLGLSKGSVSVAYDIAFVTERKRAKRKHQLPKSGWQGKQRGAEKSPAPELNIKPSIKDVVFSSHPLKTQANSGTTLQLSGRGLNEIDPLPLEMTGHCGNRFPTSGSLRVRPSLNKDLRRTKTEPLPAISVVKRGVNLVGSSKSKGTPSLRKAAPNDTKVFEDCHQGCVIENAGVPYVKNRGLKK